MDRRSFLGSLFVVGAGTLFELPKRRIYSFPSTKYLERYNVEEIAQELCRAVDESIYGDGSDGDLFLEGDTTIRLTRDAHFRNISFADMATLNIIMNGHTFRSSGVVDLTVGRIMTR